MMEAAEKGVLIPDERTTTLPPTMPLGQQREAKTCQILTPAKYIDTNALYSSLFEVLSELSQLLDIVGWAGDTPKELLNSSAFLAILGYLLMSKGPSGSKKWGI